MRSVKKNSDFLFTLDTMCYFEVDKKGIVTQIPHKRKADRELVYEAYKRAVVKKTTLYAVWPGNWSSDLFVIDDLEAFAVAFDFSV